MTSSYVPLEGPHLECTPTSKPDPFSGFPLTDRSEERWNAWGCWDDRVRYRYKKKHWQKDADFLRDHWPVLPVSSGAPVYFAEASRQVQKKYKRVMKVHEPQWKQKEREIANLYQYPEATEQIIDECSNLLKAIRNSLPQVNDKPVGDVPKKVRTMENGWDNNPTATLLQFLAFCRRMGSKCKKGDFEGGILDADAALLLFPPLSVNYPAPYPLEIIPFFYRARAREKLDDCKGALLDFRCCATTMRLIMFQKDKCRADHVQFLLKKCDCALPKLVRLIILDKVKEGASRPFLSAEEVLQCESELGIGSFSRNAYKCNRCGDQSKNLLHCAGCNRIPHCSKKCQRLDWKTHKPSCEEKWRKQTMETLNWLDHDSSLAYLQNGEGVRVLVSKTESAIAVQCIDPEIDKIFDGWTDRPHESNYEEETSRAKSSGQWPIKERLAQLMQWVKESVAAAENLQME